MIVGTAGHIDHGKTTLVRALTGVDTDRLPEEKQRGISIELGYAFLDVPGAERIGFIDVPGHERLVHTMLAGATGIDHALLLVAADDGVMPQTREHLAALSMLGITKGAVVVTKTDRADAIRIESVVADATALVASSTLAGCDVHRVSAATGNGIVALRDALFDAARAIERERASEVRAAGASPHAFRLAIDRAFTLAGIGTVVTGTVHAGRVKIGDTVAIAPSTHGRTARVRSLHAQNAQVIEAQAGQRCAVALAGIAKDDVRRGLWLVAPEVALATDRVDASLTVWGGEAKALRSGTPVHVHIGASATMGSVAVLQAAGDALQPGASGFVQIVLREPIAAWRGDRLVLRDASASRTIAGGVVLDPYAPARYRRTPQRLAELAAQCLPTPKERLDALVDSAPNGLSVSRWAVAEGIGPAAAVASMADVGPGSTAMPFAPPLAAVDTAHGTWLLSAHRRAAVSTRAMNALRDFHRLQPELLGLDAARLRRVVAPRLPEPLWRALLSALETQRPIAIQGAFVHLPEHGLKLSATDERLAQKIAPLLANSALEGAWARDLASDTRESEAMLRTTLARLAQRGTLHQVVRDLYLDDAAIHRLAAHARAVSDAQLGVITAARFRDATGLGRKRAIQILEYFDRIGLLRRVGDEHRLRSDTSLFRAASMASEGAA